MDAKGQIACLKWLLQASHDLCATREVQTVLSAVADAYIILTGGERAYVMLCEAGPDNLLPVCARGAGGLVVPGPDRRVLAAARALRKEGVGSRIHESNEGFASALTTLTTATGAVGVLFADGKLRQDWLDGHALEAFGRHAGLAWDNARTFERASNDLLTGLPNNSFFMQVVDRALRQTDETQATGVLLLDLDDFKRVNGQSGREVGDRALTDVAHTLRDMLAADGTVARFGSDKFGVLLNTGPRQGVHLRLRDVAERARAAVGAKVYGGVQLSCCIGGLALFTPAANAPRQTAHEALNRCDQVLGRMRERGRAQLDVLVPEQD